VFAAPPQKKRPPESVVDNFPIPLCGGPERFRLPVDLLSDYIWLCKEQGDETIDSNQTDQLS